MDSNFSKLLSSIPNNAVQSVTFPHRKILCMKPIHKLCSGFDDNTVYAGEYTDSIDYRQYQGINILMYSDDPSVDPLPPGNCNFIFVRSKADYEEMTDAILNIINTNARLNLISNNMLNIVQSGGSIQEMLNYGYTLLENPLMIVSVSFAYIASAGTGNLQDEPIWKYTLDHKIMPSDYIEEIMSGPPELLEKEVNGQRIIVNSEQGNNAYAAYSLQLKQGNTLLGYVKLLEKNRTFTAFDQQVFVTMSKYLSLLSSNSVQQHAFGLTLFENFFSSILLLKLKEKSEIEAYQYLFSVKLFENLQIITIRFNQAPEIEDTMHFTFNSLKRFFNRHIVTPFNNGYVVLFDSARSGALNEQPFNAKFLDLLRKLNCYANASVEFNNIEEIYSHYEQTLVCNDVRKLLDINKTILSYSEVFEYHMLSCVGEKVDLDSMIHPIVRKLVKYDNENNTNLTETLFVFTNNQFNMAATSKAMYLHYNTLKNRIARITELTNFQPDSSMDVFNILLSEKIIKYNKMK